MRVRRPASRPQRENTIALINIVFLMLIFFLIAGALAPPLDPALSLISTDEAPPASPPNALVARKDGRLFFRGVPISVEAHLARRTGEEGDALELAADRDLPAETLIAIISDLRRAGAKRIVVVTERTR